MSEPVEHLSCQEVVELVNDYLEQALGVEEAAAFEQHLNFCDGCAWYLDQIRTTVATVGRIREEEVPPETKDRLMAAFREWRRS
jgi:anti-sigma factor RsiW